ncbi:MAG: hypothetical protein LBU48_07000 [Coriobacteriales bacterium]|nr:hypothetical protein [Coriobacteriales bacterium]
MRNRVYDAFSHIKAEDSLKQNTYAFLQKRISRKKNVTVRRLALAFASVVVLCAAGLFSYNLYFTEIAFVDIDVNPSIELSLNRFDRVVDVYAYNDDGQEVLNNVNIKNKSYRDALKILLDEMIERGYLSDSGLITVTLQMKNDTNVKELLSALRASVDSVLQAENQTVEQNIFAVDSNTKNHAHEQNLTPAKYLAILELQSVDPTATFESCRDHTISEIRQQTHAHANESHGNEGDGHESELASSSDSTSGSSSGGSQDHSSPDSEHGSIEHESTKGTENYNQNKNGHEQPPTTNRTTDNGAPNSTHNNAPQTNEKHDSEVQHEDNH